MRKVLVVGLLLAGCTEEMTGGGGGGPAGATACDQRCAFRERCESPPPTDCDETCPTALAAMDSCHQVSFAAWAACLTGASCEESFRECSGGTGQPPVLCDDPACAQACASDIETDCDDDADDDLDGNTDCQDEDCRDAEVCGPPGPG
jgi:hypothetical protein